jgi:hypothetical protein
MRFDLYFEVKYCLRAIDIQERFGHSYLPGFSFCPGVRYYIGFLTYLFPYLIISRLIQRGGQQTDCLNENVFALICLSSKDLQIIKSKQMPKTVTYS